MWLLGPRSQLGHFAHYVRQPPQPKALGAYIGYF